MSRRHQPKSNGRRWHLAVAAGCVVLIPALCWIGAVARQEVQGQQTPAGTAPAPTAPPTSSDYAQRMVAVIGDNLPITREELGEYLIARCGTERLENLVNKRIIEEACRIRRIEVTSAEVEAALNEDMSGLGVDRKRFIDQVLKGYKKNLYEWKEDVIRPRLLLTKLCRDRISFTEEELQNAFESAHGEKIEGRIILWPRGEEKLAQQEHPSLRDSEDAFANKARSQATPELAASGGKIRPFARHTVGNPVLEEKVFRLHPGEVTEVIVTPEGCVVFKCDRRIPADTTVNPAAVRDQLAKDVIEKKMQKEMKPLFDKLKEEAKARLQLAPTDPSQRVVAVIHDSIAISREDYGEYLIARFGAERLENLVNKRILDEECKKRHIEVTPAEMEAALKHDLALLKVDGKEFETKILKAQKKSLYEWKEDVIRPRLLLTKLCSGRVEYTEADIKTAFEAYHGEKVEGRLIMWPKAEKNLAFQEYASIRDSEDAFKHKAKHQASRDLAATGGELPQPIGHHTTGNEELEREAFSLQPGDVSRVMETPEGYVVFKCDRRIPADTSARLDTERAKLTKEVIEKKTQLEIPKLFAELKKDAAPRQLLKSAAQALDLAAEVERELPPDYKVGKGDPNGIARPGERQP